MSRTEQEERTWQAAREAIYHAIHEAWNDVSGHGPDTFGMFLNRATKSVVALPQIAVVVEDQELPPELNDDLRIVRLVKGTGFVRVLPKESYEV